MSKEASKKFESLLMKNLDVMYRVALRLTKNSHDAEDIVSEATLKGWKNFGRLKDTTKFKPWILRIVTNCYISQYRKEKSRPKMVLAKEDEQSGEFEDFSLFEALASPFLLWSSNPEKIFLDNLMAEDIERSINELPDKYRIVVSLCLLESLTYQEAAKMLGLPVGTVRSRLHRGKSMLQKKLWEYGSQNNYAKPAGNRTELEGGIS